ncbi:hypothetical protein GCM10011607_28280 [Shewanella inventionis]|uniref:Uncharacterized protein n=2 Tax=Shewanella inventionis TaxID=1738770 RepID=A0ABQ1JGE7_9GAMM|nr:hypothetical protein GCM10011607_28280 [Shewanella inventionis]
MGVTVSRVSFETIGAALNSVICSQECATIEDRAFLMKSIIEEARNLKDKLYSEGVELDDKIAIDVICAIGEKTGLYDLETMSKVYPIVDIVCSYIEEDSTTNRFPLSKKTQLQTITRLIPLISRAFSDYTNERNLFLSVLDAIEQAIAYLTKTCNLNCDIGDESETYLEACTDLYIATLTQFLTDKNQKYLLQDDLKQIRVNYGKNIGLLILSIQSSRFLRGDK